MPEGGADFAYGDVFPHDTGMDQLHGVSFSKGCYVGQEVVSRMQHKSSLRKRIMALEGKVDLPTGPVPIMAGGKKIGLVGSASGRHGLGMVRLDQAASALEQGEVLRAGEVEVKLLRPAWADYGDSFS
jgi:folate-binding protein YgfZ